MITYRDGNCLDAPELYGDVPYVLAHVVNDAGKWGAGFTRELGNRFPYTEYTYRMWAAGAYSGGVLGEPFMCGATGLFRLREGKEPTLIAHLCAMRGVRGRENSKPMDLVALGQALDHLKQRVWNFPAGVVMPRIGCGLAGGTWEEVEPLIQKHLGDVTMIVYSGMGKHEHP